MPTTLLRPDLPPRWPSPVRAELERRQRVLGERSHGSVLDVASPDGRDALWRAERAAVGTADVVAPAAASIDTVVSVCGLVRFADLPGAVGALRGLLAPGGEVYACEPVDRPGALGLLSSSLGSLLPPVRGVHMARDLPGVLRAAGFTVTDIERFTMPTLVWPLRPFVMLRAVPTSELAP